MITLVLANGCTFAPAAVADLMLTVQVELELTSPKLPPSSK
jgi:hypothetical protein